MIKEDDIKRAFGKFQVCGFKMPQSLFYDEAESLKLMIEEWMDMFKYTEAASFLLAIPIVLKKCKYWPKPADMWEAIEEVKNNSAPRKEEIKVVKKELDYKTKTLIADVMSNHTFAQTMEIEKEVVDEARSYFPEISDCLIRKNYAEFRQLADQRENMLRHASANEGVVLVPKMNSNGFVILNMAIKEKKN